MMSPLPRWMPWHAARGWPAVTIQPSSLMTTKAPHPQSVLRSKYRRGITTGLRKKGPPLQGLPNLRPPFSPWASTALRPFSQGLGDAGNRTGIPLSCFLPSHPTEVVMRKLLVLLGVLVLSATLAMAGAPKNYQVTGPVLAVTADLITA